MFLKETSIKELIGRETCLGKAGKTFKRQLKVNQVNDNKELIKRGTFLETFKSKNKIWV